MPLLKFNCSACGDTFDLFLAWSDARKPVSCPTCRSQRVERVPDTVGHAPKTEGRGCSLSQKS